MIWIKDEQGAPDCWGSPEKLVSQGHIFLNLGDGRDPGNGLGLERNGVVFSMCGYILQSKAKFLIVVLEMILINTDLHQQIKEMTTK